MTTEKIALVTGANRGIGLEICRQLAQIGLTVILTSRDPQKGQAAIEKLHQAGLTNVHYHPLTVTDEESIQTLKAWIIEKFGRLDVLINNAGIFPDNREAPSALLTSLDTLRTAMETNLYAPLRLCQVFIPLMQQHNYGRIVNLSSGMGQLSDMNGGYAGYRTSKTALNAVTRFLADELKGTNILINSMCPGWVKTDMGGEGATREVTEGADSAVWLATLHDGGASGGFFRDRQLIAW